MNSKNSTHDFPDVFDNCFDLKQSVEIVILLPLYHEFASSVPY